MFYGQPAAALFQVEHQHSDGTWSTLQPAAGDPHDSAGSDPEREWDRGHVFICTSCQDLTALPLTSTILSPGWMPSLASGEFGST